MAKHRTAFRRFVKHLKHDAAYGAARAAQRLACVLPRRLGLALFGLAGRAFFALSSRDKRRTLDHLRLVYGSEWTEKRIRSTAREVFEELGRNLFDALYLGRQSNETFSQLVGHEGLDAFRSAYGRGKGVIVVTAHVGCFEVQLPFCARNGLRSFAIGQRLFDPRINDMVAKARTGGNMEYIQRGENPRTIVRYLKEGKAFGVLIDQDTNVEGVFAHFLGRLAFTPSGPIKMAMRFGVPLFVSTIARQKDNRHVVKLQGPLELASTGDSVGDLVRNVEMVNSLIGAEIRRHPHQWVWMHRRWRRTPQSPGYRNVPSIEQYTDAPEACAPAQGERR